MDWDTILTPTMPLPEAFLRGTITYLALLALMRIVGRRETGGLGITDVLLVVLVADAAGVGLLGEGTSVGDGFALVVTILFWSLVIDAVSYRFPPAARLLKARPTKLIEDGKLNRKTMLREFMTVEEVESQMRLHGIEDISIIRHAYIEPNGMISIVRVDGDEPDAEERPLMG